MTETMSPEEIDEAWSSVARHGVAGRRRAVAARVSVGLVAAVAAVAVAGLAVGSGGGGPDRVEVASGGEPGTTVTAPGTTAPQVTTTAPPEGPGPVHASVDELVQSGSITNGVDGVTERFELPLLDGSAVTLTAPSGSVADELLGYGYTMRAALVCVPDCGYADAVAFQGDLPSSYRVIESYPRPDGVTATRVQADLLEQLAFELGDWVVMVPLDVVPSGAVATWATGLPLSSSATGAPVVGGGGAISVGTGDVTPAGFDLTGSDVQIASGRPCAIEDQKEPYDVPFEDGTHHFYARSCGPGPVSIDLQGGQASVTAMFDGLALEEAS